MNIHEYQSPAVAPAKSSLPSSIFAVRRNMVDVTPTCVSRYSRRGLGRHGHHPSEITGRKRLEEHLAAVPLTTRLLAPNGRAFDEALDPSAPPASFAQQQLPGAEILAGREKAPVPRQTVLAPGVHVRDRKSAV